jgi:hypothetical protein
MLRPAAVVAALLLLVLPSDASAQNAQRAHPTDGLAWLSGCWERRTARGAAVTEQWMAPAGGMLLGAGRTVRGDSVTEYEQLRIHERGDTVVYHAMPSGQAPAEFRTTQVSDTLVAFDNPAHDFPQRVLYRRGAADSLYARIEGTRNGQRRGVDFRYARVSCVSPSSNSATR